MSTETDDVITTMRKAIKKIKSLRQQLADSQKQTVMLRETLQNIVKTEADDGWYGNPTWQAYKALAATAPKEQGK